MKIYVVTYCPPYAEYNSQISLRKAFTIESAAEKYIETEKANDHKRLGENAFIGDYDIEELDLVGESE